MGEDAPRLAPVFPQTAKVGTRLVLITV
jgi:hypothetical protein